MSFVRVSAITLTLLALAASAPATAQVVVQVSPQGQGVRGPYSATLERLRTAAENLRTEAERRGLTDVAQSAAQLERIARRGLAGRPRSADAQLRDLETNYRDLRRRLFAHGSRLDEAFLDVADELAFQVRMARIDSGSWPGPNPGPLPPPPLPPPPPPPPPPPNVASYLFDGALENSAVRFQGTPEQVYGQCVQFIRAMRLTNIDDLRLPGGVAVRNGGSYWSEDAACSIAVLNMQPLNVQGPSTTGRAEDLPFRVTGDLRNIIATYLPRALAGNNFIDDVVIDGRPYRNGGGYWSAAEATQLVLSQLGGVVVPTPPQPPAPQIRLRVEGDVDRQPFRFAASSAPELDAMCRNFFAVRGLSMARQITLDGQALVQRGRRPWDVSGACQLITSRARPR